MSTLTQETALMLLAAILVDTVNLDRSKGRVLPKDQEMADNLLSITGVSREDFFKELIHGL